MKRWRLAKLVESFLVVSLFSLTLFCMKAFTKTALITGIAFGIAMGIITGIQVGIERGFSVAVLSGLQVAAISGLAFGFLMAFFASILRRRFSRPRPEFSGEHLLYDGPANHFRNCEGVGGWLYLTERGLFFRSHKFNIQPHKLEVPLIEILEICPVRTFKIIPNGLRLVTRSGRDERFVVEANRKWCDKISGAQARVA